MKAMGKPFTEFAEYGDDKLTVADNIKKNTCVYAQL